MACARTCSIDALQQELSHLITSGRVSARIDLVVKTLVAHKAEPRAVAFERTLSTARHMESEARLLLLRASCERYGITVRNDGGVAVAPVGIAAMHVAGGLSTMTAAHALRGLGSGTGEEPVVEGV